MAVNLEFSARFFHLCVHRPKVWSFPCSRMNSWFVSVAEGSGVLRGAFNGSYCVSCKLLALLVESTQRMSVSFLPGVSVAKSVRLSMSGSVFNHLTGNPRSMSGALYSVSALSATLKLNSDKRVCCHGIW